MMHIPRASVVPCCRLSAAFEPDDELQTEPNLVNRANLGVHQPKRQPLFLHRVE